MPRRKKRQQPLTLFVVAVVFVASFFVIFSQSPERVLVRSDDGVLRVEAIAPHTVTIVIDRLNEAPLLYSISVFKEQTIKHAEITVKVISDDQDLTELAIYAFNQTAFVWEQQPTIFDLQKRELMSQMDLKGSVLIRLDARE